MSKHRANERETLRQEGLRRAVRRAACCVQRAVCSLQLNDPRCRDGAESLSADPHVFYKVSLVGSTVLVHVDCTLTTCTSGSFAADALSEQTVNTPIPRSLIARLPTAWSSPQF